MYSHVKECVAAGRALIATGNPQNLRYGALEARMAIEGLFYALLPHYREELPDDIVKKWQPRQVIDAIIGCNPFAQMHQQITICPAGDLAGPKFVGTYKPVPPELLRKYYHRLGSYLHAANDGAALNEGKLRATVTGALDRVEEHCRETTVIANVGPYIFVKCECGREIKRNMLALAARQHIQCPDPACSAIYDLLAMAPVMQTAWKLRTADFYCDECQRETPVGVHHIRAGERITCSHCNAEYVLQASFLCKRVAPVAGTANVDGSA